jgi:hypothetical protein
MGGLMAVLGTLAGCSATPKPTAKHFEKALDSYFADRTECLFARAPQFPLEVIPGNATPEERKQMSALAEAGLLKKDAANAIKVDRYTLTAAGERAGGRFCYGHREVASIDGFTPPAKQNGIVETTVSYHYTMMDVPVWVKTEAMEKAFPEMAKNISGEATATAVMGATGAGWEVVEK